MSKHYYRGLNSSQLIRKISQIPALWDRSHKNYRNKDVIGHYWLQIAHEMKEPVGDVRLRWKSIRERHRKERNRRQRDPNSEPQYYFYDECAFLNVLYEKPKDSIENNDSQNTEDSLMNLMDSSGQFIKIDCGEKKNDDDDDGDDDDDDATSDFDGKMLDAAAVEKHDEELEEEKPTGSKKKRKKKSGEDSRKQESDSYVEDEDDREIARLLKLIESENNPNAASTAGKDPIAIKESKKINHVKTHSSKNVNKHSEVRNCEKLNSKGSIPILEDADKAFFASLLPHLRKLNSARKLRCRMDIQKIIYKYAYEST